MNLQSKCQVIELLLADVDGVLTDGSIIYNNQGIETKRFHVRDGVGIKLWQKSGNRFGIVTQRSSHAVRVRAGELGVDLVRQGAAEKTAAVSAIVEELGLGLERVAYIGDDLPDLPVIHLVGLGVAVADAADEVRAEADYVTSLGGGRGAVREAVEMILKSQRRWEDVVRSYLT